MEPSVRFEDEPSSSKDPSTSGLDSGKGSLDDRLDTARGSMLSSSPTKVARRTARSRSQRRSSVASVGMAAAAGLGGLASTVAAATMGRARDNLRKDAQRRKQEASKTAQRATKGTPSRVGMYIMELFTSKVVMMMLLILICNAIFEVDTEVNDAPLRTLKMLAQHHGLDSSAFNDTLALYVAADPLYRGGAAPGSLMAPRSVAGYGGAPSYRTLLLAKVHSTRVFEHNLSRIGPPGPEMLRITELEIVSGTTDGVDDCPLETTDSRNFSTLIFNDSMCSNVMVYDAEMVADQGYLSQIYLTVALVLVLTLGMLLIGSNMQRYLLSPLERITKIIKIVTGARWRKAQERRSQVAARLARQGRGGASGERDVLGDAMEELELEVYTVFRMVLVLLEDMEQAFGIRMGRYRVKMFALETSFDKFFLFAHQVLAHYEDTHMTVDQLAHTLWQLIVQEFPTTIKRIASRQGKMGQLLHWWDMLERPRQWIIDSFRQTLTATIRKGLGVPAGAPQYDPRKLAIKDVRTYVQIRLTQIIRRDCLKLGRPVPADESKLSLLALWRHVRALAVARVVAKLHKHGVDVETPAEEGDGPGGLAAAGGLVAVYRGLVASILAALKAACEHEGLPPPQNEAASLSEWVEIHRELAAFGVPRDAPPPLIHRCELEPLPRRARARRAAAAVPRAAALDRFHRGAADARARRLPH